VSSDFCASLDLWTLTKIVFITETDCALCKACVEAKETIKHQASLIANLPIYNISIMIDCTSVAKIQRNLIVCVQILSVWEFNIWDNNTVNAEEVLFFKNISQYAINWLVYNI
jgi:hypothetical protein